APPSKRRGGCRVVAHLVCNTGALPSNAGSIPTLPTTAAPCTFTIEYCLFVQGRWSSGPRRGSGNAVGGFCPAPRVRIPLSPPSERWQSGLLHRLRTAAGAQRSSWVQIPSSRLAWSRGVVASTRPCQGRGAGFDSRRDRQGEQLAG